MNGMKILQVNKRVCKLIESDKNKEQEVNGSWEKELRVWNKLIIFYLW